MKIVEKIIDDMIGVYLVVKYDDSWFKSRMIQEIYSLYKFLFIFINPVIFFTLSIF